MKLLKALAVAPILAASVTFAPEAQASSTPAWAYHLAAHTCEALDNGYDPKAAGERAAKAVLKTKHGGAMTRAYNRGEWEDNFRMVLFRLCPDSIGD